MEILLARMLRLDRTAPCISSARKLVPFLALPNGTSDILAVARRPQLLGGADPEPSHKSLAGHPLPPMEWRWTRQEHSCVSPSTRLVTVLLVSCLLSGCGIIMVGEPVQKKDLSSEDDAEENLKAIRAMLADQAARTSRTDEKPYGVSPQPAPADVAPSQVDPAVGTRPLPSPSSSAGKPDVPAKLPWTPAAPERPGMPDRPVPAYTTPAPVGPDYSGSIRCAPDGMGGQRCVGR